MEVEQEESPLINLTVFWRSRFRVGTKWPGLGALFDLRSNPSLEIRPPDNTLREISVEQSLFTQPLQIQSFHPHS